MNEEFVRIDYLVAIGGWSAVAPRAERQAAESVGFHIRLAKRLMDFNDNALDRAIAKVFAGAPVNTSSAILNIITALIIGLKSIF